MKVLNPNVMYDVEIEKEEIEILTKAYEILDTIYGQMRKAECDTLQGGYEECNIDFYEEEILDIKDFLKSFLEDVPTKMYQS